MIQNDPIISDLRIFAGPNAHGDAIETPNHTVAMGLDHYFGLVSKNAMIIIGDVGQGR